MSKNGQYSNLFNAQLKQESYENNGEDSLESDEDLMEEFILDGKDITTEYGIPSTSQTKNKEISLKVSMISN